MVRNMSNIDGYVRWIIAAAIAVLFFTKVISGTLGIVLLVLAGIFVLTGIVNFCPIYRIFGISTCKVKS